MEIEIIASEDGSHTLFLPALNETYHSLHGAFTESAHIYIKEGLAQLAANNKTIRVLEIGFGTGLNAFLSLQYAKEQNRTIFFETLEPFPLPAEIIHKLNYTELLEDTSEAWFLKLHEGAWGKEISLTENFSIFKRTQKLEDFEGEGSYDIVFFDAFGPGKQPDVWGLENIKKCFMLLKEGGLLVTYCAQGQFKRNMKEVGFQVEVLPGPPGKKEMTRGRKLYN